MKQDLKLKLLQFDMFVIYIFLTAVGLTPCGSSTVHVYTQTVRRTTQLTGEEYRAVPRLFELYPGICLTTEEEHGKTSFRFW
jgi:hypothetical protein